MLETTKTIERYIRMKSGDYSDRVASVTQVKDLDAYLVKLSNKEDWIFYKLNNRFGGKTIWTKQVDSISKGLEIILKAFQ